MGKVIQGTSFTFLYGDFPWKSLTVAHACQELCVCFLREFYELYFAKTGQVLPY